jgi:hypothetical protein
VLFYVGGFNSWHGILPTWRRYHDRHGALSSTSLAGLLSPAAR